MGSGARLRAGDAGLPLSAGAAGAPEPRRAHASKEFVALAKQKGAQLNYGSAGPASSSRLAYELFKDVAGIETVPVHYKGGGPAIQDLLSGQVQVMLIQGGGSIPQYVKTGKLVALGDQLARALEVLSRAADHRRDLSRLRDRVVGGDVRAGGDAASR